MTHRRYLVLVAVALLAGSPAALSQPSPSAPLPSAPAPATQGSASYQLGENDVIEVRVFNQPDLTRIAQVTADGTVTLGLVETVRVAGLTAQQVQDKLDLLYAEYLVKPQVFVTVTEYRSQVIQVFGAVRNPGQHRLTGPAKVLDVLSQVGGPSEQAGDRLFLLRKVEPKKGAEAAPNLQPEEIDLHALLQNGDTRQNLLVKAGDVLYAPRADEVYVLGEVKNPGAVKFEDGMTVTQAISKVAGFTRIASRRVQVVRVQADGKRQYDLHVGKIESGKEKDFVLKARDLVVVPESWF